MMSGWRHHTNVSADRTVHVWPDGPDVVEHDLDGPCVCGPKLEEQPNGNVLVLHHSLDDRERYET